MERSSQRYSPRPSNVLVVILVSIPNILPKNTITNPTSAVYMGRFGQGFPVFGTCCEVAAGGTSATDFKSGYWDLKQEDS